MMALVQYSIQKQRYMGSLNQQSKEVTKDTKFHPLHCVFPASELLFCNQISSNWTPTEIGLPAAARARLPAASSKKKAGDAGAFSPGEK